jgi:tetratricopeptide (TPR) repeat protein
MQQQLDDITLFYRVIEWSKQKEDVNNTDEDTFISRVYKLLQTKPYTCYAEQQQCEQLMKQLEQQEQCSPTIKYILQYVKLRLLNSHSVTNVSKSNMMKQWDQFIQLRPSCPLGYYGRAQYYLFKVLDPFSAVADLDTAIQLVEKSDKTLENAELYTLKADAVGMYESESEVLSIYDKAISVLSQANVEDRLKIHVLRAKIYKSQHRIEDAINECSKIIELEPSEVEHYNERALLYKHKKNWEKALEDLNQMIALQPDSPRFYLYRFDLYSKNIHDYPKAEADIRHVIELEPDYARAYHLLAQLKLDKLKEEATPEIVALYEKFTNLEQSSNAYYLRGEFYEYMLQDIDQAKECYGKSIELGTDELAILAQKRLTLLSS